MSPVGPRRTRFAPAAAIAALLAAFLLPAAAGASSPVIGPKQHGALSPDLARLAQPSFREMPLRRQARLLGVAPSGPGSLIREGNRVLVEIGFAEGAAAQLPDLRAMGARILAASGRYQRVTASVPTSRLPALTSVAGVSSVSPVQAPVVRAPGPCEGGSVISEGVQQLKVEAAREKFPFQGEGVTVGVLSDSFDQAEGVATTAEDDVESKDLPGVDGGCPGQEEDVDQLQPLLPDPGEEEPFVPTDEGRGMLQIVHDVAPAANLAFASAFNGEEVFAKNIRDLHHVAGAQVIVDDVGYFKEPFFQDGPVATAISEMTDEGVAYFSAAGNDNLFSGANEISSWEAPSFRDAGDCPPGLLEIPKVLEDFNPHHCLDFDPGQRTDRTFGIVVEPEETLTVDLQWAEPWYGVDSDFDIFLLDAEGVPIQASGADNVSEQRPVDLLQWTNESSSDATVQLVVNRFSGSNPRLKFILLQNGGGVAGTEYPRSGGGDVVGPAIYGHAGSADAITVGAVRYSSGKTTIERPEPYSSRGPVLHLFGPVEGITPAPRIVPQLISKPDIAATDCGRTTFFAAEPAKEPGIWRFCGTSAAAPHAAGVAALMLAPPEPAEPPPGPEAIRAALVGTGTSVGGYGSCSIGAGLVNARLALEALNEEAAEVEPSPCLRPDASEPVFVAPGDWGRESPSEEPEEPEEPEKPEEPKPEPVPPDIPPVEPIEPPKQPQAAPNTFIARHPAAILRTRGRNARAVFRFGSDQAGVSFLCRIDASRFRGCPVKLSRRFVLGSHVVRVKARNVGGLMDSSAAVFRFRVQRVR